MARRALFRPGPARSARRRARESLRSGPSSSTRRPSAIRSSASRPRPRAMAWSSSAGSMIAEGLHRRRWEPSAIMKRATGGTRPSRGWPGSGPGSGRRWPRPRRAAALPAQLGVDDPVRLAGAVVPGRDQPVQLACAATARRSWRRGRRPTGRGRAAAPRAGLCGPARSACRAGQQLAHLVRARAARGCRGSPLLLGARHLPGAELAAVVEHPVERRAATPSASKRQLQLVEAARRRWRSREQPLLGGEDVVLVGAPGPPSTWSRSDLHLGGEPEQRRHRRQEHRGGLAAPPGPDEPADGLGEEQRRGVRWSRTRPTASRGMSTPSETIRTATIQRSSEPLNAAIFVDARLRRRTARPRAARR